MKIVRIFKEIMEIRYKKSIDGVVAIDQYLNADFYLLTEGTFRMTYKQASQD